MKTFIVISIILIILILLRTNALLYTIANNQKKGYEHICLTLNRILKK